MHQPIPNIYNGETDERVFQPTPQQAAATSGKPLDDLYNGEKDERASSTEKVTLDAAPSEEPCNPIYDEVTTFLNDVDDSITTLLAAPLVEGVGKHGFTSAGFSTSTIIDDGVNNRALKIEVHVTVDAE